MLDDLACNWWAILMRGVATLLFGLAILVWPLATLFVLVLGFGIYAVVQGVFSVAAAFGRMRQTSRWWVLLVEGLLGVAAGVVTFLWPGITALTLLYIVAAWAIVTGVFRLAAAIRLRSLIENEWALTLGGILALIWGAALIAYPGAGALSVAWLIGVFALAVGVLDLAVALRLRPLATMCGAKAMA